MVVRDFDLIGISILPSKAHPVLSIYPNTVLPSPLAAQSLEEVTRRHRKLTQFTHTIDLIKFPLRSLPNALGTPPPCRCRIKSVKYVLRPSIPKGSYHVLYYIEQCNSCQPSTRLHRRQLHLRARPLFQRLGAPLAPASGVTRAHVRCKRKLDL